VYIYSGQVRWVGIRTPFFPTSNLTFVGYYYNSLLTPVEAKGLDWIRVRKPGWQVFEQP
jgi:hypothetical protein